MVRDNFLLLTGHDYRSARKANMHFIARELAKRGTTRMFSIGYSPLSNLRGRDPRLGQGIPVNVVGHHNGIDCYLWRTLAHPFNLRSRLLNKVEEVIFKLYRTRAPSILREWAAEATVILVESGLPVLFLPLLKEWNPKARIIYIASDDLDTIRCAPFLSRVFRESADVIDGARIPSPLLVDAIPSGVHVFHVPHGIDPLGTDTGASPYGPGINAVSVGSMLFDPDFFHRAVRAFPDIRFHVIGSGKPASALPSSVSVYPEMPHADTVPYLKHADVAIAPYKNATTPYYLADTSMKLMQYGYFGIPAVCPHFAVGTSEIRFGYQPGDSASIEQALRTALSAPRRPAGQHLSWSDVTDRILRPRDYPDVQLNRAPADAGSAPGGKERSTAK